MQPGPRKEAWNFVKRWPRALVGSVVSIPLVLFTEVTGKNPALLWFVLLIFAGVIWDLHVENKRLRQKPPAPKLFLRLNPKHKREDVFHMPPLSGEFLVQVQGDEKVFGVKIVSSDAVGKDHQLLRARWSVQEDCVGNAPVDVHLQCTSVKGVSLSNALGQQARTYLDSVKNPVQLVAKVSYTDVEGKSYEKSFKIYKDQDWQGFTRIHCEPLRE
jgi:hypothetical protein